MYLFIENSENFNRENMKHFGSNPFMGNESNES